MAVLVIMIAAPGQKLMVLDLPQCFLNRWQLRLTVNRNFVQLTTSCGGKWYGCVCIPQRKISTLSKTKTPLIVVNSCETFVTAHFHLCQDLFSPTLLISSTFPYSKHKDVVLTAWQYTYHNYVNQEDANLYKFHESDSSTYHQHNVHASLILVSDPGI